MSVFAGSAGGIFSVLTFFGLFTAAYSLLSLAPLAARALPALLFRLSLSVLLGLLLFASLDNARADETRDALEKCFELAVKADKEAAVRKKELDKLGEWEKLDQIRKSPRIVTEYETKCDSTVLRGCLLPPWDYAQLGGFSKEKEFVYRRGSCQDTSLDCPKLQARAKELKEQKPAMEEIKDKRCVMDMMRSDDCIFYIRQLVALIDAIAVVEIAIEKKCMQY